MKGSSEVVPTKIEYISLELEDFRQFRGRQRVDFARPSADGGCRLTLIAVTAPAARRISAPACARRCGQRVRGERPSRVFVARGIAEDAAHTTQ